MFSKKFWLHLPVRKEKKFLGFAKVFKKEIKESFTIRELSSLNGTLT